MVKIFVKKLVNCSGYEFVNKSAYNKFRTYISLEFSLYLREKYLREIYTLVKDIEGDIVECGVGNGNSLLNLCRLAYFENKGRKIYVFDSFEGFPEPSIEDESERNTQKGEWNVTTVESIK